MSSMLSSSLSHAATDSLTTVLQAPFRSFLCQNGTIKSITSSFDKNSHTPSEAKIKNLSSSFVWNSLISDLKHKKPAGAKPPQKQNESIKKRSVLKNEKVLTWYCADPNWVRTRITYRATHGQSRILLVFEPYSRRAHIFAIPAFVALDAPVHLNDARALILVVRLVVPRYLLRKPCLLIGLDTECFWFDFWVLYLVVARSEWAEYGPRVAGVCSHYTIALNHGGNYGSSWKFIAESLMLQVFIIVFETIGEHFD